MVVGMFILVIIGSELLGASGTIERFSVCHSVCIALLHGHSVDIPATSRAGQLMFRQVGDTHVFQLAIVVVVLSPSKNKFRILRCEQFAVEHRPIGLERVNVLPTVGEVLMGVNWLV